MKQRLAHLSHAHAALLAVALTCMTPAARAAEPRAPDPARVEQIRQMLPEAPRGVGPTIDDRQPWQAVAAAPEFRQVVSQANRLISQPIPELTDELYLDYSRTGNRSRYERVLGRRYSRLPRLVLAECIENRGRFLPAIEEAIRAICADKTWVYPAHDGSLRNFKGLVTEIDLHVAAASWNLATADYWLGDKLSGETRKLIRSQLERRTFTPFTGMVTQGEPRMWWLTTTNNWNAVCLAGVTGSAMAVIDSPERRAFFAASAEKYIRNFLSGFTPDGYCSEGLGYWNYGFGHYVLLAETLRQATGGKLDLFELPEIREIALFGHRMEIASGIYPAFADCSVGTRPQTSLMAFLSRRYGLGLSEFERRGLLLSVGPSSSLFQLGVFAFPNSATATPAAEPRSPAHELRDWFPDAGILICRPAAEQQRALAVALKGGHNDEHHNHNDVGSYLVVLGRSTPLVDPGAEVYTARTFSSRRYESNVLNSFGHPVPRVAGKLQRTGRAAAAKVLKTGFTEQQDTIVLDLSAAYDVKQLKKLQRTFVFSREGTGSLTVTDEVEFDSPQSFGTALITFSDWKRLGPNQLQVGDGREAVRVEITTDGPACEIQAEEIKEDVHGGRTPTRLGIDLTQPVNRATITLKISPTTP
jgi:hypothetical protein